MSGEKIDPKEYITRSDVLTIIDKKLSNLPSVSGINGNFSPEIKPNYLRTNGEKVIDGYGNCFIVLGRDRDAGVGSGFGGKGTSGASCIDLVAGHQGSRPIDTLFQDKVPSSKDFKNDSARIYISQMSSVDKYFQIPKESCKLGNISIPIEDSTGKSAIAAKSDHIRLIGREAIKLVTNHNGVNSLSKSVLKSGISLIAGYDRMPVDKSLELQPMVKGNNLQEVLKEIILRIEEVQTTVLKFMQNQKKFNDAIGNHTHQSNAAGLASSTPVAENGMVHNIKLLTEILPDIITVFKYNASIDGQYFNPSSPKYINSLWNKVN